MKKSMFFVVMAIALIVSGWSMYGLAVQNGVPRLLAIVFSVVFDGLGVFLGTLSMEYAKSDDNSFMIRVYTWIAIVTSAVFNYIHGNEVSMVAGFLYSLPSIAAGIAYEEQLKFDNRTELRKRGRVPRAMPKFQKAHWLLFFKDTFSAYKKIVKNRLNEITENAEIIERVATTEYKSPRDCVVKNYRAGISTEDMFDRVIEHFPEVRKTTVSAYLSSLRKGKK